jgi:hypothetical protein
MGGEEADGRPLISVLKSVSKSSGASVKWYISVKNLVGFNERAIFVLEVCFIASGVDSDFEDASFKKV